jgi:hypothetical protein
MLRLGRPKEVSPRYGVFAGIVGVVLGCGIRGLRWISGKSRCGGRRWGKDKKLHVSSAALDSGGMSKYRYGPRECGVKVEWRMRNRWGMLEFVRHLGDETGRVGTMYL